MLILFYNIRLNKILRLSNCSHRLMTHALAMRNISQLLSIVSPSHFTYRKIERGSLCALNARRRKFLNFLARYPV